MDVLSQNEIDALLNALSSGEVKMEDLKRTSQKVEYKSYDFRRPNKFSKEQLRSLQALHSVLARLLSTFLTGYLRNNISFEVASVDQMTYEDFISSIPSPTVFTIFALEPLNGKAIIQFDPMFLFPMIDLFFGGRGEAPGSLREFTDIELSVARNLAEKFLENLALAWKDIVQVKPVINSVETNPHLHQIFSFNEIVVLITLTSQVGDFSKGYINLCLPFPLMLPVLSQLTYKGYKPEVSEANVEEAKKLQYWLGFPAMEMTVLAGQTQITVNDFLLLQEGDVLLLDRKVDQNMDLYIGDLLKFKVQPGTQGNQLAVQITALVTGGEQDV
jgi:flagellar motor switch protein FliM